MRLRTWHAELLVVAIVEVAVTAWHVVGGGDLLREGVCALAVCLSFAHAQVADRLAERDAARARPSVECHRWASRYLVTKELAWTTLFALTGTWSAIAGSALFALYPLWRRLWRKVKPRVDVDTVRFRKSPADRVDVSGRVRVVSIDFTQPGAPMRYVDEPDGSHK